MLPSQARSGVWPLQRLAELLEPQDASGVAKYRHDPVGFANDCIAWPPGQALASYQSESMADLLVHKRVAERGPRGLGKTATVAIAVLWYALTRDGDPLGDWKVITTAAVYRQLTYYLWPEIHKWARRLRWDVIGRRPLDKFELLDMSIKLSTGQAFAVASDKSDYTEGGHAAYILWIVDEAKAIPDAFFDSLEGSLIAGIETLMMAISTPGGPVGRFYDICSHKPGYEDWHSRHVTMAEAIKAFEVSDGLFGIDPAKVEQRRKQWGENSPQFQTDMKGEFAALDKDGVVPFAWVSEATQRWQEWDKRRREPDYSTRFRLVFKAVGVDIADSGDDDTCMALLFEETPVDQDAGAANEKPTAKHHEIQPTMRVIEELRYYHGQDVMQTTGHIAGILEAHANGETGKAIVDGLGVGAGVAPRLREQGHEAIAFIASAKSEFKDASNEIGFKDSRAAAWWNLREMLDPEADIPLALPPDDRLAGEIVSPKYRVLSGARLIVESKDDLRKPTRLGRSTDAADAVIHALWFDRAGDVGMKWGRMMKKAGRGALL